MKTQKDYGVAIWGLIPSGLIILFSLLLGFVETSSAQKDGKSMVLHFVSFSHDGTHLLVDICKKAEKRCFMHRYEIGTGGLGYFRSPREETWGQGRYSEDGTKIVFTITPIKDGFLDLGSRQIALMDPDGRNVKAITHSPGVRIFPSFSHSGKKVIYARAEKVRTQGRTPAAEYDVFEADVETGEERKLTDFQFFQMSAPQYFPDDKKFVYYGEYPKKVGDGTYDATMSWRDAYKNKYRDNWIFVQEPGKKTLEPFIAFGEMSRGPLLDSSGKKLFFEAQAPKANGGGIDYFLYSPNGQHRRITHFFPKKADWSSSISPDAERLAVIYTPVTGEDYDPKNRKLAIFNTQDGSMQDIALMDQAFIINH